MALRFNPPPNRPASPSPGWLPPAGWRPDPAWGVPPPGWQLVVEDTPRRRRRVPLVVKIPVAAGVGAFAFAAIGSQGNGPEYLSGTARVIGSDIYDLDRDGDGVACEQD